MSAPKPIILTAEVAKSLIEQIEEISIPNPITPETTDELEKIKLFFGRIAETFDRVSITSDIEKTSTCVELLDEIGLYLSEIEDHLLEILQLMSYKHWQEKLDFHFGITQRIQLTKAKIEAITVNLAIIIKYL